MATSVKEFLIARRAEIDAEIVPLLAREQEALRAAATARAEIDQLFADRDEVVRAASALGLDFPPPTNRERKTEPAKPRQQRLSLQGMALQVIQDAPEGLTSRDVLHRLNRRFNAAFPRTSLSPQLSRLKRQRLVTLRGGIWTANQSRDKKGPDATAPEPSVSISVAAEEPNPDRSLFGPEEPRFPSRETG